MKIIVCVGDDNAMLFHNRRVSRDRAVIEDIFQMVSKEVKKDGQVRIWMNEYSSELFQTHSGDISVSERFLEEAGEDEYCFVENVPILKYEREIQTVVLYRWNRNYPADVRFLMDLSDWKKMECVEFPGHSHEKITKEVYRRERTVGGK